MVIILLGVSLLYPSCDGGDGASDNPPVVDSVKPSYPTFGSPNWTVKDIKAFEHTMTVAVVLPDSLSSNVLGNDKLAAFVGSECRGVAEQLELTPTKHIWMITAYGNKTMENLTFKYYSSKTKYMYHSAMATPFVPDGNVGNIDNPQVIGMKVVTEEKLFGNRVY